MLKQCLQNIGEGWLHACISSIDHERVIFAKFRLPNVWGNKNKLFTCLIRTYSYIYRIYINNIYIYINNNNNNIYII